MRQEDERKLRDEYLKTASAYMENGDTGEIASALEFRDVLCAEFVKEKKLAHEPNDSDVIEWIASLRVDHERLKEEVDAEQGAHEQIGTILLPLVEPLDGTSVGAARMAAEELRNLRAQVTVLQSEVQTLKQQLDVQGERDTLENTVRILRDTEVSRDHWIDEALKFREGKSEAMELTAQCIRSAKESGVVLVTTGESSYEFHNVRADALESRLSAMREALQKIAEGTCSCGSTSDPNWHSNNCRKAKAARALLEETKP